VTWNYRIVQTETDDGLMWGVYEVYYDEDDRPISRTEDPIAFTSDESAEDVRHALSLALTNARTQALLSDNEIGGMNK
jgi:hypothetical protein